MLGISGRPLFVALLVGSWLFGAACDSSDDDPSPPAPPPISGGEGGAQGTGGSSGGKGGSKASSGGEGGEESGEPGIATLAAQPLRTTEAGAQETFGIVLETRPTANVTIPLRSSDDDEGTVSPESVTFTPQNWNAPQLVTVSGVDDNESDGDATYSVEIGPAASSDDDYDGLRGDAVELTNIDDETAGITVDFDPDPRTSEAGAQEQFSVVLNSEPTGDVRIAVESSDDGEGMATPAALVFTPDNWNAPQVVTVQGVDDDVKDGDQEYSIVLAAAQSSDSAYDGLDAADVALVNVDNESAGVTRDFADGLLTGEDGTQATFRLALNARPSASVSFALTSSDETEGTVTPAAVVFTPDNWNAPQVVTIKGVDDDEADGLQPYQILIGSATSSDDEYDGLGGGSVPVANVDDESAGIRVAGDSRQTTEDGGQATLEIQLSSRPTASVTLSLSSSDTSEGTIAPVAVTFTPGNWDAPQVITVTGVDDEIADGSQQYRIITAALVSSDPNYDGLSLPDVTFTNIDNDTPGVTVSPLTVTTTEAGGDAEFTVVLNSQPSASVTIAVESDDEDEGLVSPATLTFTPDNWDAPQEVTVTGQDDDIDDGNQAYFVRVLAAESDDDGFDGVNGADVEVTNTDDETAGITVSPQDDLVTTEGGGDDAFTIVLNSEPTSDVTITLSSSDPDEGTPSPGSVTFTPENWDAPQEVTVTGENDDVDDGNQTYTILVEEATSEDDNYDDIDAHDVEVSNTDDETAGITVSPQEDLVTTEGGGDDTFTIVLNSEPTSDVTITLSSSDPDEGTPSPTSVTFTPENWDAPQEITVTGENDDVDDGNQTYTIMVEEATSEDDNYDGIDAHDVALSNTDDETSGITVSPEDDLVTTEGGGDDTFTIVLNSEPTADVTIALSSSKPEEGTPSPSSVTFTPEDWDAPQTITVTGEDDELDDGDQVYTIEVEAADSSDDNYDGLDGHDVSVSNTDNETAGITVTPLLGLTTTESGGDDSFTIVLDSEPTHDVTITLSSSKPDEGTPSPTSVTFTPENWDAPQEITVTGEDDDLDDGDQVYTIEVEPADSSDDSYDNLDANDVAVTNGDDETAGITVSPTSGLTTTEANGEDSFTIVLDSEPTNDVTITLSSSKPDEGEPSPASVTFTSENWDAPQTITVTGHDDDIDDGNQTYTIEVEAADSSDDNYDGIDAHDVNVSNTDDETAGITVSPQSGLTTTEAGGEDSFTIVLDSEPTEDVVITLSSSKPDEGVPNPTSVTFTAGNWDTPQTVTVEGEDDDLDDGNQTYTIEVEAADSADETYDGIDAHDVSVSNTDDETAGITVSPTSGLITTEAGGDDTFTIVLESEPTDDVIITLSSSKPEEGEPDPATVTFTPENWDTPQTITVEGQDDVVSDGDQIYTIEVEAADSADPNYEGRDATDVSVTNQDNDADPGITLSRGWVELEEWCCGDTVTLVLDSQPTDDVTITLSNPDPGAASLPQSVFVFTPANWDTPQDVVINPVPDGDFSNESFYIDILAAVSADPNYNGLDAGNIDVYIYDWD